MLKNGRYSLYTVTDIYTRRIKSLVSRTARTDAVLQLLRSTILEWGVPDCIRTDNGSDFTSVQFVRALAALAIRQELTTPYSGWEKGTIERVNKTLMHGLMPLLPGFIGHNVADRKKIEARKSFAQRLGTSDSELLGVDLDATEFQAAVNDWISAKYNHRPHAGKGMDGLSPVQKLAGYTGRIKRIENERALDLMLAPIPDNNGLRTVTASGIRVDKACFLHTDMVPGTSVLCRHDPADFGRLYVYDEAGLTFLYVAVCAERLGQDPGDLVRAARKRQAERIRDEVDPLRREIRRIKPRDVLNAVLEANAGNAGIIAFPKSSEVHTTPALKAAGEAAGLEAPYEVTRRTEDQKKARLERTEAKAAAVVALPETPRQRFRRALALERSLERGEAVAATDVLWLGGYQTTAEYKSRREVAEDFGKLTSPQMTASTPGPGL